MEQLRNVEKKLTDSSCTRSVWQVTCISKCSCIRETLIFINDLLTVPPFYFSLLQWKSASANHRSAVYYKQTFMREEKSGFDSLLKMKANEGAKQILFLKF